MSFVQKIQPTTLKLAFDNNKEKEDRIIEVPSSLWGSTFEILPKPPRPTKLELHTELLRRVIKKYPNIPEKSELPKVIADARKLLATIAPDVLDLKAPQPQNLTDPQLKACKLLGQAYFLAIDPQARRFLEIAALHDTKDILLHANLTALYFNQQEIALAKKHCDIWIALTRGFRRSSDYNDGSKMFTEALRYKHQLAIAESQAC